MNDDVMTVFVIVMLLIIVVLMGLQTVFLWGLVEYFGVFASY